MIDKELFYRTADQGYVLVDDIDGELVLTVSRDDKVVNLVVHRQTLIDLGDAIKERTF